MHSPALCLLLALTASCAATDSGPGDPVGDPPVRTWGEMREVLREGHSEGRVVLAEVLGPHTIAVGAAANLAAEITIDAGEAHLAEVIDGDPAQGLAVRPNAPGEEATLLVMADVKRWNEHRLPAVADLTELEALVRSTAEWDQIDVSAPFPFRVEGTALSLQLHVLNHSCPIADPEGPAPWRFEGQDRSVTLVGFYAEHAGGRLTHHGQNNHTHAMLGGGSNAALPGAAPSIAGHLDDVRFAEGARLFLPAQSARP